MKLRILSQYYENYAAHNDDWDGESEGWKPKGGIEFFTELTDAQDYLSESELVEVIKIALAKYSSKIEKFEYLDMDRVYSDPQDITGLFNESFAIWREESGFNKKFECEKIDPRILEIISDAEETPLLIKDDEYQEDFDEYKEDEDEYASGGNIKGDTINYVGKDIYVLKVPLGQKGGWSEVIRDFFNKHDGKVSKKIWDDTMSVLKSKKQFTGLAAAWKEYKKTLEIETVDGFYVNPYHFANGGTIQKSQKNQIRKINKELEDFDLSNLDPYEEMIYTDMINKSKMSKANALQVIINNVEGDYSQLDEELAAIAEKLDDYYSGLGEDDEENEVMARGGNVKKKRTKFSDKVEAISHSLEGKKVPPKYQKDYGKRYGHADAEQAGRRIAGAMLKKEMEKYEDGGTTHKMKNVDSAKHPKTGEVYSVGDRVCIYQGRFGHNNIIVLGSIWEDENDPEHTMVSENATLPGTYLSAVKHKVSDKEMREIQKSRQLSDKYSRGTNYYEDGGNIDGETFSNILIASVTRDNQGAAFSFVKSLNDIREDDLREMVKQAIMKTKNWGNEDLWAVDGMCGSDRGYCFNDYAIFDTGVDTGGSDTKFTGLPVVVNHIVEYVF